MLDKEKQKMKRAREAELKGEDGDVEGEAVEKPKGKVSQLLVSLYFVPA